MINARQYELLKELKRFPHYVLLRHFAESLSCSEKTISSDIKALNVVLASNGLETRIETKPGSGVRLIVRAGEESSFETVMLLNAGSAMTSFDRFYRGILFLVLEKTASRTLDALAAHLFTNRRRVQLDIRHWNSVLAFFSLAIKGRKGSLFIEGDEYALRTAIMYFFYMVTPHYQQHVIEPSLSESTQGLARKLVDIMCLGQGTSYARNGQHAVLFYVKLAMARIRNDHQLPFDLEVDANCDEKTVKELHHAMERGLNCPVSMAEAKVIASSQVLGAMRDPQVLASFVDDETKVFVHTLRGAIERRYGAPIDIDTVKALESLSYQSVWRMRNKLPVSLFNATPMKQRNLDWLMTLERILHSDVQLARVSLFADDVARMAMLLYPYWSQGRRRVYRVALFADASFEQAEYGVHCIEVGLPFIQVVKVISGVDIALAEECAQSEGDIDFIIGFGPLETSLPFCQISSSIVEDDLMCLMKFALELEDLPGDKPFDVSSGTLNQESVQEIVQAVYWDLCNDGIIKAPFEEFSEQFSAHCAISTKHMTTALCVARTPVTGMRVYSTPALYVIQPVLSLAVLYIAEKDIDNIGDIVRHFNKYINRETRGEHTYSMPPQLLF